MEEQKTLHEFDEFEKLLGEIPNVTYGKPNCEETGPKMLLLDGSMSPIKMNTCEGLFIDKLLKNGNLVEGTLAVDDKRKSLIRRVQTQDTFVHAEQLLTSAFSDLRLNKRGAVETEVPPANCRPLQSHAALLDIQYPNSSKKSMCDMTSSLIVSPPSHSPFDDFNMAKAGQHEHASNLLKLSVEELNKQSTGCWQPLNAFSDVPAPGGQYSAMIGQHRFLLDARSPLLYLHPQQIGQSQNSWRNIEEEKYNQVLHQQLFQQQLRTSKLGTSHPMQANGTVPPRLMFPNQRHQFLEVSEPHQVKRSVEEWSFDNYMILRDSNQSYSSFSSVDCGSVDFMEEVEKQIFSGKILARPQRSDTPKTVKFGSIGRNELQNCSGQSRKVFSNGNFWNGLCTPYAESFDIFTPRGLSYVGKEYRSTNLKPVPQKHVTVDEVEGRIYFMAKDQHGCRFLQRKFVDGTLEDVEKIFNGIIDYTVELMTDPFGNYLIQKLLEVCDEDKRMQILLSICKPEEFVRISCDMHGTRAVQKLIETLKKPEQFSVIVSSLKTGIVTLMKNVNGNHVAQRCLHCLMPEYKAFLFEAATNNCIEIATDRHGCCVLQKCLSHSNGEQKQHLVQEITSNSLLLSTDPFGNYVLQFVLDLQLPWATIDILEQLEGNYADLSIQKHSSNVVERCLKYADNEHQTSIIQELMENSRLDQIMLDQYGNYVIQVAIKQSKGSLNAALMDAIRPHVPALRNCPYGKKVLSLIS